MIKTILDMTPQDLVGKITAFHFNGQSATAARNALLKRFPLASMPQMTKNEYRQTGNKNTFCYNLEFVPDLPFGIGGQSNNKFGNESNARFPNVQGIYEMISDADKGMVQGLRSKHHLDDVSVVVLLKILAIYLPDKFLTIGQDFTLCLLARILGINQTQKDLIELNYLCAQELLRLNPTFANYQFNQLGSAVWQILSPANKAGFSSWLKKNMAPGSGTINAYVNSIERLSLYYRENYFHTGIQIKDLDSLYNEAMGHQQDNGGKYYYPSASYGNNLFYSAAVKSYKNYILSLGSPIPSSSHTNQSSVAPATAIQYPRNLILYGPPGTGKTYNTIRYAVSIIEGIDVRVFANSNTYQDKNGNTLDVKNSFDALVAAKKIYFTTFHQSLSYEDFIEGIKPEPTKNKNNVLYEVKPGILKLICEEAFKNPSDNYVLVIDEINRGNVASIFGELITLIEDDKRAGEPNCIQCILPYSKQAFSIPRNLYILGTMNTADRSVEALDTALRRRFDFLEMMPDPNKVVHRKNVFEIINNRLRILKDTEHQLGHSYFIEVSSDEELCEVFHNNIIPLIQEYFYGDIEKIRLVIGDGFCVKETVPDSLFPNNTTDIDIPTEIWRLWDEGKWQECKSDINVFTDALGRLING